MKVNYLDVFSGIGGFALGLQMAGFEFEQHYFSEVEKYAIKVYEKHWPEATGLGDITKIKGELGRINIISAGFPCQDISVAGNQKGIEGSRSGLFYEIIRLAEIMSPDILYLENVANLLGSNEGRDMGAVLRALAQIGYDAEWDCVPASYVGAPHRRDRIWIVGYPKHNGSLKPEKPRGFNPSCDKSKEGEGPTRESSGTSRPGNGEDVANSNSERCNKEGKSRPKAGKRPSRSRTELAHPDKPRSQRHRGLQECTGQLSAWACCRAHEEDWLARSGIRRISHGVSSRVHRLKCLGNAVVPQVVEYIARIKVMPILLARKTAERKGQCPKKLNARN